MTIEQICNSYFNEIQKEFLGYLKNDLGSLSGAYFAVWRKIVSENEIPNSQQTLKDLLDKILRAVIEKEKEHITFFARNPRLEKPSIKLQKLNDEYTEKFKRATPNTSPLQLIYNEICVAEGKYLHQTEGLLTRPLKSILDIFDKLKLNIKNSENEKQAQQYFACWLEIVCKEAKEKDGELKRQAGVALGILEAAQENLLSRRLFSPDVVSIANENAQILKDISDTVDSLDLREEVDEKSAAILIINSCIQQALLAYFTNALIPINVRRIQACSELISVVEEAQTPEECLQYLRDKIYEIEQEHTEQGTVSAFPFMQRESRLARYLHLAHLQISKSIPQTLLPKQSIIMREIDKAIIRYWEGDWFYHNKNRMKVIRDLKDALRVIEKRYQIMANGSDNIVAKNTEFLSEVNTAIGKVRKDFDGTLLSKCYMWLGVKRKSRLVNELENVRDNLQRTNNLPKKDLHIEVKPQVVLELNKIHPCLLGCMSRLNKEEKSLIRSEVDTLIVAIQDLKTDTAESIEVQIAACIRGLLEKVQNGTFWQEIMGETKIFLNLAILLEDMLLQLQKNGFLPANTGYVPVLIKIGEHGKDVANQLHRLESVMGKLPKEPEKLKEIAKHYKSSGEKAKQRLQAIDSLTFKK